MPACDRCDGKAMRYGPCHSEHGENRQVVGNQAETVSFVGQQGDLLPPECGTIYADEMNSMDTVTIVVEPSKPSMRRTLLTLLGAIGAFGILTASYATAELPGPSATEVATSVAPERG